MSAPDSVTESIAQTLKAARDRIDSALTNPATKDNAALRLLAEASSRQNRVLTVLVRAWAGDEKAAEELGEK